MVINPLYRAQLNIPGIAVPAQNDEVERISNLGKLLLVGVVCSIAPVVTPEYAAKLAMASVILFISHIMLRTFFDR